LSVKQTHRKIEDIKMSEKSLKPIIDKLESLFSNFNQKFYNGKLQKPVITVSPDTTKGAYGWCTTWKAWKEKDEESGYYEINLCAEHLARPFPEVCATLLHEMVHLWNLQNNVQDTSRGGTYHNKKFKQVAEEHGLIIDQDSKYGWTITSLNDEAKAFIDGLKEQGFEIYRSKLPKIKKSKSSSSRKYVCPHCGLIIRATKEVHVICSECGVEFEEEI
jgi:rubrerythrin